MPFPSIIQIVRQHKSSHLAVPLGVEGDQAFMPDYYHVPALVLSALFLPAFGYLYLRFRDARTLLWFLGFVFALVSMALRSTWNGPLNFAQNAHPWLMAVGQTRHADQLSSFLCFAYRQCGFGLGQARDSFM